MNDAQESIPSVRVSPWRLGAGMAVLAGLAWMGALLAPVYLRNLELEKFLREIHPASDEVLRKAIRDKGNALGLDLAPDHLQIRRSPTDGRTSVRYVVRVHLPLYTVDLHFASGISGAAK